MFYDQFTSKAAEGRKMPVDKLRKLAGGRVYTGRQALANGLGRRTRHAARCDSVEAKQLAGIEQGREGHDRALPEPTNFFESLFGEQDAEKEVQPRTGARAPAHRNWSRSPPRRIASEPIFRQPAALVMPFELEIR